MHVTLETDLVVRRPAPLPPGRRPGMSAGSVDRRDSVARPVPGAVEPGRRPGRPDDPGGEGRPALRRLGGRRRRRRRRGPAPARAGRSRCELGRPDPRRPRPADPAVRHRAGRPGRRVRAAWPRSQRQIVAAEPVRHPRPGARGVPDRARRLAGHRSYPVAAVLGRERSTPPSSSGWRRRSARPCAGSASTRASRRSSTCVRDLRWGRVEETIGEDPLPGRHHRQRLRARPGGGRRRRDAEALRRATPPPAPAATSPRCRWARASWPTCCCRRSRWRCGPAPAR